MPGCRPWWSRRRIRVAGKWAYCIPEIFFPETSGPGDQGSRAYLCPGDGCRIGGRPSLPPPQSTATSTGPVKGQTEAPPQPVAASCRPKCPNPALSPRAFAGSNVACEIFDAIASLRPGHCFHPRSLSSWLIMLVSLFSTRLRWRNRIPLQQACVGCILPEHPQYRSAGTICRLQSYRVDR